MQDVLPGALAAISCVGAFGSQADMLRINGAANAAAIATAKAAGVQRFVYISAHTPPVPGIDAVLSGYIQVRWVLWFMVHLVVVSLQWAAGRL
jgi:hypothetical protein